jgi:hypothetical protein
MFSNLLNKLRNSRIRTLRIRLGKIEAQLNGIEKITNKIGKTSHYFITKTIRLQGEAGAILQEIKELEYLIDTNKR